MQRKLLITVFSVCLSTFILFFLLNLSGFCFAKMRWLSKEEKIESVFNYLNNRGKLTVDTFENGVLTVESHKHIKYSSFEEYVEQYPDCCAVNPGGGYDLPPPSMIEQMFGFNSGDVIVIKFNVRYLDENKEIKTKEMISENFIQNCGKVYNF